MLSKLKIYLLTFLAVLTAGELQSTCAVVWSASATWNGLNWGVGATRYTVNSTVKYSGNGNEYRLKSIPGFNCSPVDPTFGTTYWTNLGSCASSPTVTTTAISGITCATADGGGNVTSDGGASVTARGVCWNTGGTPTTSDSKTTDGSGTGSFNSDITGLSAGTTYYVRAYATNVSGTGYGAQVSFTATSSTTAGSIGSAQTICYNTAPATLTETGAAGGGTGSFTYQWQSSLDNSAWSDIGGATSTTYSPGALTVNTYYRRQATSSDCGTANSASVLITIDPLSVGGSIASAATVCTGSNGATLTLSGHTGSITKWQYSTDNWSTPVDIVNTTTTNAYSNITTTTKYRAVVQSGTCAATNSADVEITVSPTTVAGSVASAATVCSGSNGATLTLSGNTGSVTKWQYSTDNWATPVDIVNATTSNAYSNITATTKYRAVVQSGACAAANSADVEITVTPALDPGVIKFQ